MAISALKSESEKDSSDVLNSIINLADTGDRKAQNLWKKVFEVKNGLL